MNRVLLDELQQLRSFPSISLLFNTRPGATFGDDDRARTQPLVDTVRQRLAELVDHDTQHLVDKVVDSISQLTGKRSTHAVAICVSEEHDATVLLGGSVDERVVIDETFATRDLVADLNRTALYRVVAVSDSMARSFAGDRRRLVEERSDSWPLRRDDEMSGTIWSQTVTAAVKAVESDTSMPTITAGVPKSAKTILDDSAFDVIGHVAGNHDRTAASELHTLVWPIVLDWKGQRQTRAFEELDAARSSKRYAAGVDEIWPLAEEGRVEHLVVEDDFSLSARIDENGHLHRTDEDHRDVTEDVIDELIEAVLRYGGHTTIVEPAALDDCGRVAAVLRF